MLYLEVGNMDDILNMSVDDFFGVIEAMNDKYSAMSGKPQFKELNEDQLDMIKKAKG